MEKMTAQAVFDKAFQPGRTPRSDAYRQGVLACLQVRLDGLEHVQRPYEEGTAEFGSCQAICRQKRSAQRGFLGIGAGSGVSGLR